MVSGNNKNGVFKRKLLNFIDKGRYLFVRTLNDIKESAFFVCVSRFASIFKKAVGIMHIKR